MRMRLNRFGRFRGGGGGSQGFSANLFLEFVDGETSCPFETNSGQRLIAQSQVAYLKTGRDEGDRAFVSTSGTKFYTNL